LPKERLNESRDIAIKHIQDYSHLLDTYGPSERLTKYLIVAKPRPNVAATVNGIESVNILPKDSLKRLD